VAARNEDKKISGIKIKDLDKIAERSIISAKRLIEGGPAIFVTSAINHQRHGVGRRVRRPLVKKRLRVPVIS